LEKNKIKKNKNKNKQKDAQGLRVTNKCYQQKENNVYFKVKCFCRPLFVYQLICVRMSYIVYKYTHKHIKRF